MKFILTYVRHIFFITCHRHFQASSLYISNSSKYLCSWICWGVKAASESSFFKINSMTYSLYKQEQDIILFNIEAKGKWSFMFYYYYTKTQYCLLLDWHNVIDLSSKIVLQTQYTIGFVYYNESISFSLFDFNVRSKSWYFQISNLSIYG